MNSVARPKELGSGSGLVGTPYSARQLKVLHIGKFYPPHKGGIESHLQALAGELRKSVDLRVLVASDDHRSHEEVLDRVVVSRVPTHLTLASTPVCTGMISKIRGIEADIIHLHWPNPTAVLSYLASKCPGRLVITYHSDVTRQRLLGALFEPFLHSLLRRSSAILITSPNYLESSPILAHYRERCHLIPLGIDLNQFNEVDPAQVAALRNTYGDRLILSVGRMVYYKGFEYLIRAMSQVRGKLLIIGDGPLRAQLQKLTADLELTDRVFLSGEVPGTLAPYYQASDVFALASVARSEAFGIVQVEAMASGIPVVNTRIDSGVPFVSLDGQTGFTVPPRDPSALAVALNRLLDDQALRRSLGDAARLRARQEFSLEMMAARTLAVYSAVMDRNNSSQTN